MQIGVVLPRPPDDLGEWLADATAFEAAGADVLWIDPGPAADPMVLVAALAALTYRSLLVTAPIEGAVPPLALATVKRLSRDRFATGAEGDWEQWERVPPPEGRAAWRETLADATGRGVPGLLVPADPRLLDLLRNPVDPGGRHDLHLAQG
ncbi:MAG TPA: hypothetical protein VFU43_17255 [Streptosporangiaceae bacterium]|nr:hypothetical protein [Streptosporangiaceae bacterium]